jgi:integrase
MPGPKRTAAGTWQARWRDPAGRSRAKNFGRKVDAARHQAQMRGDVAADRYVAPNASAMLVRTWADEWLAGAMNLGEGGRDTYRRDLDRHILPVLGGIRLRRLDGDVIAGFLADELAAGLAPSTVHRHYRTIRRMCQVAVTRGRMARNPCDAVTPPRVEHTEMRFLTVAEIDGLRSKMPERYRAWVWVAVYAGLRWSELVGLRRTSVDGERITVTEQLVRRDDGTWRRGAPKTRAGRRTVTVPKFVAVDLEAHLNVFSGPGDDGLVFPNGQGRPLIASSWTASTFKPACARAGLGKTVKNSRRVVGAPRVHDLRHTSVALAIAVGAHPKAIQARMGHASITTTLNTYGHLFPEMDGELAVRLDRLHEVTSTTVSRHGG